jgi:hypothetical protein
MGSERRIIHSRMAKAPALPEEREIEVRALYAHFYMSEAGGFGAIIVTKGAIYYLCAGLRATRFQKLSEGHLDLNRSLVETVRPANKRRR